MTVKQAVRSLIAYLNHFSANKTCALGHEDCAIRKNGVCIKAVMSEHPKLARMTESKLRDLL